MGGIVLMTHQNWTCTKGPEDWQEYIPQIKSTISSVFLAGCNGHQVVLIWRAALGNSQLQPNSVWSWPFHMQSTKKCEAFSNAYENVMHMVRITSFTMFYLLYLYLKLPTIEGEMNCDKITKPKQVLKSHWNQKRHPFQEHITITWWPLPPGRCAL